MTDSHRSVVSDKLVFANGVDGTTGDYLVAPMTTVQVASAARAESVERERITALIKVKNAIASEHLGLPFDVDPLRLSQAGWGVVFQRDEDEAVKAALEPLIAHRSAEVAD